MTLQKESKDNVQINHIYQCLYCDKRSFSDTSIKQHIRKAHNVKDEIRVTERTIKEFLA